MINNDRPIFSASVENQNCHWGFTALLQNKWREWCKQGELLPARIINQHHHIYTCALPGQHILNARVSGTYHNKQRNRLGFPVVGDWVGLELPSDNEEGIILDLFPRLGGIHRWAAGDKTQKQVIAANLDYVLLVFALDGSRKFLSEMLERSLTAAWKSGADPLIVLNKSDCVSKTEQLTTRTEVESIAQGVPVCVVSAKTLAGIEDLAKNIEVEKTVSMLGKSGVGKSALVNAFFSLHRTQAGLSPATEGKQREDGRGRHTTTNSQLYPLPWGSFIVDVPGLRELKIWSDVDDVARSFPDVEMISIQCRFRNCSHNGEPGCAIFEALGDGRITVRRYESYKKLHREVHDLERRQNQRLTIEGRRKRNWNSGQHRSQKPEPELE